MNTDPALSPHHSLFITNDSPSDADEKLIRSLLAEAEAQDALFKSQRQEPDSTLRCQLHLYTTTLKSALSSIRRIPPEILMEIFLMKGRRWESPYYDILNEHKGPWIIAKVCRVLHLCLSDAGLFDRITRNHMSIPSLLTPPTSESMIPHSRHCGVLLLTRSNGLQSLRTIVFNLAII